MQVALESGKANKRWYVSQPLIRFGSCHLALSILQHAFDRLYQHPFRAG